MSRIWRIIRFGLIERYLFRTALGATLACALVLTAVIWVTQALKELDLLTAKGQTVIMFLSVTGLSLPALVTIITPVALFIACIFTLNKLNSDSELIVISAAGASPLTIFKPLATLSVLISVAVGFMTIYVMPASFRGLQDLLTTIRADVIANIIKEGQFTTLDRGVVFHYRDRNGPVLQGIFIQDRRDTDKVSVYLAERGETVAVGKANYLLLEKGSVQRLQAGQQDSAIVVFDRYAIDLSEMVAASDATYYKARERTTWELLNPGPVQPVWENMVGRYRSELHDRLSAPLYPIAFTIIAFAALGTAKTTRQGRGVSMAAAVLMMILIRGAGFAVGAAVNRSATAIPLMYIAPVLGAILGYILLSRGGDLAHFDPARLLAPLNRIAPRLIPAKS